MGCRTRTGPQAGCRPAGTDTGEMPDPGGDASASGAAGRRGENPPAEPPRGRVAYLPFFLGFAAAALGAVSGCGGAVSGAGWTAAGAGAGAVPAAGAA